MNVALVVMPFAAITRPSLAAGLLQASLRRAGVACESVYLNLLLGEMLGPATYRRFSSEAAITALAGEWAFSQAIFGERLSTWRTYQEEVLDDPVWGTSPERHDEIQRLLTLVPAFLDRASAARDWRTYDVIGFTSTFEQTLPSLCLAQRIRERHPSAVVVLGGANFEAEMGRPYLDEFECVDFISTGEADTSFVQLCTSLREFREGRAPFVSVPAGFVFRDAGGRHVRAAGSGTAVGLESLPTPDYDDFFCAAQSMPADFASRVTDQWLPVEASRGCWWGEKVHCTFCGLNGDTMRFRRKSARRVIQETDELVARHGVRRLQFADNILSRSYFDDLLPSWAERPDQTSRFFEIKSNLSRDELALMRRAGVTTIQAGIESLSDHTLRVMGKGVSAAQNLALLRWCRELGIDPLWNLIYGFPREHLGDYGAMLDLLRQSVHLPPPDAAAPIRMDRFSPNFANWAAHGFTSMAPMRAYRHVLPFTDAQLAEIAYYFRYDHPQMAAALEHGRALSRFAAEWQARHRERTAGDLAVSVAGRDLTIADTRFTREPASHPLALPETAVLMACDRPASTRAALTRAQALAPGYDPRACEAALAELLDRRIIVQAGSLLVTLACLYEDARFAMTERLREEAGAGLPAEASAATGGEMALTSEELS